MNSVIRFTAAAILLLSVRVGLAERALGSYGISDGGSSWQIADIGDVPGIAEASVSFVTLFAGPPEGVPFVVWSDLPNGRSGNGSGSMRDGASYRGEHSASGGRKLDFQAFSADGRQATVTIAGVKYDTKNGRVFLVSAKQQPPIVKQLAFDTTKLPRGARQLAKFAQSTDAIRQFFENPQQAAANPR